MNNVIFEGRVRSLRRRGWPIIGLLLAMSGCGITLLPESENLIDFQHAEIVPGATAGTFDLVVRGVTPTPCYDVSLVPLVYIQQPEYWGIQVTAQAQPGNCSQVITPFEVRMALNANTGTIGVEVIGRSTSEKLAVPPS